jgi:hypothetical protein
MFPTLSSLPLLPVPLAHLCPPADVPLRLITWAEAAPAVLTIAGCVLAVVAGWLLSRLERGWSLRRALGREVQRSRYGLLRGRVR